MQETILLGIDGGVSLRDHYGFTRPMYADAQEIVRLIKLALQKRSGRRIESVRTLESGIVEEHALVADDNGRKHLLVRIWPVFYAHRRRVEYKRYEADEDTWHTIADLLDLFARVNRAELQEKR